MITNGIILDIAGLGLPAEITGKTVEVIAKELEENIKSRPRKHIYTIDDLKVGQAAIERRSLITSYPSLTDLPEMTPEELHKVLNSLFLQACKESKRSFKVDAIAVENKNDVYWWTHFGKFRAELSD